MLSAVQAGLDWDQAWDMPLSRLYQILHAFGAYNGLKQFYIAEGTPDEEAMAAFEAIRARLDNPPVRTDG